MAVSTPLRYPGSMRSLWLPVVFCALGSAAAARADGPFISPQVRVESLRVTPKISSSSTGALQEALANPAPARLWVQHMDGVAGLLAAGFPAQPLTRTVSILRLPPGDIARLLQIPGLLAVDVPHRLRPLLDKSAPLIGVPAVRTTYGLTGAGVLIGVVDTGIDLRHADFRKPDGHTRVRWLLDAATPRGDLHPELPDYRGMALYTDSDINALLDAESRGDKPLPSLPQKDVLGHGTHVAGIAAGSGRATGNGLSAGRYVGLAPDADLCVVQATRTDLSFADEDILAGVKFCVDRASDAHQAVVVNLSLGGNSGPHDGSTPLEQALNEVISDWPGRALVAAAGNSGGDDGHAGAYRLAGERTVTLQLTPSGTAPVGSQKSQAILEIYSQAQGGGVSIAVRSPKGQTIGPVAPGKTVLKDLDKEGHVIVDNGDTNSGLRGAALVVQGLSGQQPAGGAWQLVLSGQSDRYDVWLADSSDDVQARLTGHLDADTSIGTPATAQQAISVGSVLSRTSWVRSDGKTVRRTGDLGAGSFFTSAGPTADGRFAPDVAAPGEFIAAALSQAALPTLDGSAFHVTGDVNYLWADDGVHGLLRGTSQAAPHVTGVVALLLQENATLHTESLRELLRTTARGTLGYSPRVGFGRLDAGLLLRRLRGDQPGALSLTRSVVGVSRDVIAPGQRTTVTVVPKDDGGLPLGSGLSVSIGVAETTVNLFDGAVRDVGGGRYERTLIGQPPLGGKLTVVAQVKGVSLPSQPVVFIAAERAEIGQAPGCGVIGGAGAGAGLGGAAGGLWGLLGLGVYARRRRARSRRAHSAAAHSASSSHSAGSGAPLTVRSDGDETCSLPLSTSR